MIRPNIRSISKPFGEWDIKLRSKNSSDYTQLQLSAFLWLLAAAGCAVLALVVMLLLRDGGLGVAPLLYFGAMLLLALLILLLLVVFSRQYVRPFREIDGQLDALISGQETDIRLPHGPVSTGQRLLALQEAMQQRALEARLAQQRKTDLVVYLAHDIRTPLTSVIGYLNLLEEAGDMPEEQRKKYIHITLDKACHLERMIDEFFEITRYHLQQIRLNREELDLYYMLVQLTDELLPVLEKNGNIPVIRMETEMMTVYGDGEKLARVFSNILKNAAAYSDPGTEIVITAAERNGFVEIAFCNQGEDIPPDKLGRMFDKFYRIDEARNSRSGGTGLGLAIAKEIITLHGGAISAHSENHTVTFVVTIPVRPEKS
ncbi:MAG: vancomycin resistance histidine kinase VanS [Oscillospiraceae bacterium]|nr:MAG: vancomycin resistance histidine kinase VanS [Oscillospiraceae bacterium]